jgi:hypothetical protein
MKDAINNVVTILVNVFEVFWFPEKNYGREKSLMDTPEQSREHSSLMAKGWWLTEAIPAVKISHEDKERAVTLLEALWKILKESTVPTPFIYEGKEIEVSPSEMLRAFEENFTNGKGKVHAPKFDGVAKFQRGGSLLGALALRVKLGIKDPYMLPVHEVTYENEYERASACIMENTGKLAGARLIDTHWPSLYKAGKVLATTSKAAGTPAKEIDIIRVISGGGKEKRGTGQKVYYMVTLDARFPKLGITERMNGDKGQEWGRSLDRNRLQKLEMDSRQDKVSEEEIEKYLANPQAGKGGGPIVAKKSIVEEFYKNSPNKLTKYIMDALFVKGSVQPLNVLDHPDAVEVCNKLFAQLKLTIPQPKPADEEVAEPSVEAVLTK